MKNTKRNKELLLEQLRKTPVAETACQKLGLSKMTLYRWKRASPKFAKEVETALIEGRKRINDIAESVILAGISKGEFKSSQFWLKNNDPRYADKLKITGTVRQKRPLTPEEKRLKLRALKLLSLKAYGPKKK